MMNESSAICPKLDSCSTSWSSSSTEGPDSPGMSPCGSPILESSGLSLETKRITGSTVASGSNRSAHPSAHRAQFEITFLDSAPGPGRSSKTYTLMVWPLQNGQKLSSEGSIIKRTFDEFIQLHQSLSSQVSQLGVIVPPVPDEISRTVPFRLGLDLPWNKLEEERLCYFIRKCLSHPVIAEISILSDFFLSTKTPTLKPQFPVKVFFSGLYKGFKGRPKSSHQNEPDLFGKERQRSETYCQHLLSVQERLHRVLDVSNKLSQKLLLLAAVELTTSRVSDDVNVNFSQAFIHEATLLQDKIYASQRYLGSYLATFVKYFESEVKAIGQRDALIEQDGELSDEPSQLALCTQRVGTEIRQFHVERVRRMKETLLSYSVSNVKYSKAIVNEVSIWLSNMPDVAAAKSAHT
ncbi:hypothetical protein TCAL_09594 [Tigriopus californicus]|uniref:PX domain-containing protein n=1 Tax=Tigriopus californicus TaxID=6832 RepID=A0A553PEX5_TIGCA|nr:uncharacterized protein LOC131880239 [Tigriopus californicus]TRY76232.1 hypothetical protein TCAL_09594 [Tigriopus californicus]|eukprot:TCALIF_09594-PA protein Name:"Protein of unknown function" AED:0.19 eAED:0.19 QI:97/1/0.5/1/1/0.5/2/0/407